MSVPNSEIGSNQEVYQLRFIEKQLERLIGVVSKITGGGGGGGSVMSFAFTNLNGFTGIVTNPTTTPTLSLTLQNASGSQSGQLSSTDWNTFNNKLTSSLTSAHILVGSSLNVATSTVLSGDATINNVGVLTVVGIRGATIAALSPGYVKYNGSSFVYDNSTFLTTISGITAGGDLGGTYANPSVLKIRGNVLPVLDGVGALTNDGVGNLTWSSVAGSIANALSVDNSSLQYNTGTTFDGSAAKTISVKALGITNSMIANATIDLTTKVTGLLPDGNISSASTWNAKQNAISFGTGVLTALGINVGSAGALITFNGAAGTPSSIVLTNATGLPPVTGISGWPSNSTGVLTNNGSGTLIWDNTNSSINPNQLIHSTIGTLISDDFNRGSVGTNWAVVGGVTTYSIVSNRLRVTSGDNTTGNYLRYDNYGFSNLESFKTVFTIIPNALGTDNGVGYKCLGTTGTFDVRFILDNTGSNLGKISITDGTRTTTSNAGITISTSDILTATITVIRDKVSVSILNTTTGKETALDQQFSTMFNGGWLPPGKYKHCISGYGSTNSTDIDNFSVIGLDVVSAEIVIIGTSLSRGYYVDNDNRWSAILSRRSGIVTVTNACSGCTPSGINATEVLALAGKKIIIEMGANDPTNAGLSTLVSSLTGYTAGVNLFFTLITPHGNNAAIVTGNAALISTYGISACIDVASEANDGSGNFASIYSFDGLHPNSSYNLIEANIIADKLGLSLVAQKVPNFVPVIYNSSDIVVIADKTRRGTASANRAVLELLTGTVMGLHVSSSGTSTGAYFGSNSGITMSNDAYHNGVNYIAATTTPSVLNYVTGTLTAYSNTGATVDASFSPTQVWSLATTGLSLPSSTYGNLALSVGGGGGTTATFYLKQGIISSSAINTFQVEATNANAIPGERKQVYIKAPGAFWQFNAGTFATERVFHVEGVPFTSAGSTTFTDLWTGFFGASTTTSGATATRNWGLGTSGNLQVQGSAYIGAITTAPTAYLQLAAGTATASTAPLKFTTGTSLTSTEVGAVEYTTDDLFFTISTGTARKRILFADAVGGLTSGRVPYITTNGRLTDSSVFTFDGTRLSPQFITLAAGTTAQAPLVLTSGTNLTSAINGAFEYNGTDLLFTKSGTTRGNVLVSTTVTTEALTSDTSATITIGGTTYKVLLKA